MIVYRIVVIALLFFITLQLTGNPGETTTITVVFNIAGAIAYYGLERLWGAVNWGVRIDATRGAGAGNVRTAQASPELPAPPQQSEAN